MMIFRKPNLESGWVDFFLLHWFLLDIPKAVKILEQP